MCFNPLPDYKFYSSKLKEFADDNFKFDESGRKLSKRVENTVGKGEIARYEAQRSCLSVSKIDVDPPRYTANLSANCLGHPRPQYCTKF